MENDAVNDAVNDDVNDAVNDVVNDAVNDAKRHLIDELSNEQSNINVLRIRNICRDYPGIISTTGLRLRIWSLLLLGQEDASVEQGIIYITIIIIIIIIIIIDSSVCTNIREV